MFAASPIAGFLGRWLTFAGVLLGVGTVVFRWVVLGRANVPGDVADALRRRAARVGMLGVLLVIPGALARLYYQTAEMRFPDDPWLPLAKTLLTESSWGWLWFAQVALAVLLAVALSRARCGSRGTAWRVATVLAIALVATPSLASHAMSGATSHWITLPADLAHVVGASAWIGTLAVMFGAVWGDRQALDPSVVMPPLLERFSPLALTGAGVVVASGVISSIAHIKKLDMVPTSTYGRLLLGKVAIVLVVAALGWFNWQRMTPRVGADGAGVMRRSIVTELLFAVLVLALTAALVITPPPGMGM